MSEAIYYRGRRYTRNKRGYYSAPRGSDGESFLHRQVYVDTFGPIPTGMIVHHIDHDKTNNDPGNLAAVTRKEHAFLHKDDEYMQRVRGEEWQAHLAEIRAKAADWHRSPEGREWHRAHAKKVWGDPQPCAPRDCTVCGKTFSPLRDWAAVCSRACHMRNRNASGVDNEDRTCEWCGATFSVNRYSKTRFCGRSCSRKATMAKAKAEGQTLNSWAGREPAPPRPCDHCGAEFRPMRDQVRLCSTRCRNADRRATGVDNIDATCEWCGAVFAANKYKHARFCGRSCATKASHAARGHAA